jgi:hypothetical protein
MITELGTVAEMTEETKVLAGLDDSIFAFGA